MTLVPSLRPRRRNLVIDLVEQAGVDVSDWANYSGGIARRSTNPKYCYDWAFHQPGKVVVLSLWFEDLEKRSGKIIQRHSFLEWAATVKKTAWRTRARRMNAAVAAAWEDGLPVRVIICDGVMRDRGHPDGRASRVTARQLDDENWAVTAYDAVTGAVTLTRGATVRSRLERSGVSNADLYPDELHRQRKYVEGAALSVLVNAIERDPRARRACLKFHGYRCAACDLLFSERYGSIGEHFIHVHHLKPLSLVVGPHAVDPQKDLAPVCPNCHAMLHKREPPMSIAALRKLLRANRA